MTIQITKTMTNKINITSGIINVSLTFVVNLAADFDIAIANLILLQMQIIIRIDNTPTPPKI